MSDEHSVVDGLALPQYQSHKIVSALKLRHVIYAGELIELRPTDVRYGPIRVAWGNDFGLRLRQVSAVAADDPGYYVVYHDGYRSWSPTSAFEAGYSRLGPPSQTADEVDGNP